MRQTDSTAKTINLNVLQLRIEDSTQSPSRKNGDVNGIYESNLLTPFFELP